MFIIIDATFALYYTEYSIGHKVSGPYFALSLQLSMWCNKDLFTSMYVAGVKIIKYYRIIAENWWNN